MLMWIFRIIFVVIILGVLFISISSDEIAKEPGRANFWIIIWSTLGLSVGALLLDLLTPKKSLASLAGVFFGLLVGMFISWALSPIPNLVNEIYQLELSVMAIEAIRWIMAICICYLVITIVIRTKDDFRFVIPYVEFAKQTKGARPLILDTSAIIDGRIADLYVAKLFDSPLIVPRFVLNELQFIADSADKLKRNRGRRGLDILNKMQNNAVIDIKIDDTIVPGVQKAKGVDQKIVIFTKDYEGRLATTDYNLTKVAQLRQVDVLNINDLASSLKTIALPGETMKLRIIKPGEEMDQGIGYLADGTMIVVENGRDKIGKDVVVAVTSSLQTSAGKMIFGKFERYDNGQKHPQVQKVNNGTNKNI